MRARLPFNGCDYVLIAGSCPSCSAHIGDPPKLSFKVQGMPGSMFRERDRYKSTAVCIECNKVLGQIIAVVNTIFGIEEDERILHGRARVY